MPDVPRIQTVNNGRRGNVTKAVWVDGPGRDDQTDPNADAAFTDRYMALFGAAWDNDTLDD